MKKGFALNIVELVAAGFFIFLAIILFFLFSGDLEVTQESVIAPQRQNYLTEQALLSYLRQEVLVEEEKYSVAEALLRYVELSMGGSASSSSERERLGAQLISACPADLQPITAYVFQQEQQLGTLHPICGPIIRNFKADLPYVELPYQQDNTYLTVRVQTQGDMYE